MTISESQRRTLDLMAESIGWDWQAIEHTSDDMFGECVAGLTSAQARRLLDAIPHDPQEVAEMDAQSRLIEVEPGVVCDPCSRCGEQCPPSPNDALCWKCAKEVRNAAVA